jgi:hypothetical protein
MNPAIQITIIIGAILALLISLYFTFSDDKNKTSKNTGPASSQKSISYATPEISSQKSTATAKAAAPSKKTSAKAAAPSKKTAEIKNNKITNDNNYLTCGAGIQNCPPPKPAGKCKCNASESLLTYFDGNH